MALGPNSLKRTKIGEKAIAAAPINNAINAFCDDIGITRRGNEMMVAYSHLEHFLKKDLNDKAPRTMAILNKFKLVITNVPENFDKVIEIPLFPKMDHNKDT